MSDSTIRLSFAPSEVVYLTTLIDEFIAVIATPDDAPDSGIERLTPDPYPEDAEASTEFAAATHDDLLDRRVADAAVVRSGLGPLLDRAVADSRNADDPDPMDIVVPGKDLEPWLRSLTALRLVIATRLNITDDNGHDLNDPRFGVFDWLGYRLDELIALADASESEGFGA